jgi:hypothetical protein
MRRRLRNSREDSKIERRVKKLVTIYSFSAKCKWRWGKRRLGKGK